MGRMKRYLMIITGLLLGVLLTACGAKENTEEVTVRYDILASVMRI